MKSGYGDYMQCQTYTYLKQRTEGKISKQDTSGIYRSTDRLSNKNLLAFTKTPYTTTEYTVSSIRCNYAMRDKIYY